jgi:hypothetical protein
VKSVSDEPDGRTWTCEVRMRGDRLPDVGAIARHLEATRTGASLRGVEAVVVGRLERVEQGAVLRLDGTGEVVRLGTLTRKVQWNTIGKCAQAVTAAERGTLERLLADPAAAGASLRVMGPLSAGEAGKPALLEVREYAVER